MILSIITDRGWVFVDYIYIGRANLLQLIFIISFSLHAKALLVKTVRAVLLNMYWTPITVTVNLDFSELTANEEVFWKFIFFPDAKAKLKRCSWKYLICYLKPEKEIISCMEATRALDSPYLNLFTRWLRSVVLKSLKAVKQKFPFKKKLWGNIEIRRMIRPGVKSENSVFPLQLQRVSNSNKQQICSAAEHGPRWTKCT